MLNKKLNTIICWLVITHILVWSAGYLHGFSSGKRSGINEITADIQRVRDNESRVIKQLDTIESRLGASAEEAKELSREIGQVSNRIDSITERNNRNQSTLKAESELIREGSGILENIKERGTYSKD
jgi:septal ring factor EnvC (AmiA/AmiB activator)